MTKDISDKEEDKEKYINICAAYYSVSSVLIYFS